MLMYIRHDKGPRWPAMCVDPGGQNAMAASRLVRFAKGMASRATIGALLHLTLQGISNTNIVADIC